jgi:hypothetical protein
MVTVLVSATVLSLNAFHLGVLARQRTQLVDEAVAQAEGLRSYRDNNPWATFSALPGASVSCQIPSDASKLCFTMTLNGGVWQPTNAVIQGSSAAPAGSLPASSIVEIVDATPAGDPRTCRLILEVHYGEPVSGSTQWQEGTLSTELVNQNYGGGSYGTDCTP